MSISYDADYDEVKYPKEFKKLVTKEFRKLRLPQNHYMITLSRNVKKAEGREVHLGITTNEDHIDDITVKGWKEIPMYDEKIYNPLTDKWEGAD